MTQWAVVDDGELEEPEVYLFPSEDEARDFAARYIKALDVPDVWIVPVRALPDLSKCPGSGAYLATEDDPACPACGEPVETTQPVPVHLA